MKSKPTIEMLNWMNKHIILCSNIECDRGFVITDSVAEDGKFILEHCPLCKGKGWIIGEEL